MPDEMLQWKSSGGKPQNIKSCCYQGFGLSGVIFWVLTVNCVRLHVSEAMQLVVLELVQVLAEVGRNFKGVSCYFNFNSKEHEEFIDDIIAFWIITHSDTRVSCISNFCFEGLLLCIHTRLNQLFVESTKNPRS